MPSRLSLTSAALAEVIDAGANADPATRAELILEQTLDPADVAALRGASLATRDAWLLRVRCASFGEVLPARLVCPACQSHLALEVPKSSIPLPEPSSRPAARVRLEHDGLVIEAQVPDGAALAAAATEFDVAAAREVLIEHCVIDVQRDGRSLGPAALDQAAIAAVGQAILEAEPGVEPAIEVTCATCASTWSPVFDIGQFLWREVAAAGAQLLDEVHDLAMGYGWTEDLILRLSSRRRREYVDRLNRATATRE
jgi:hypothetical protein